MLYTVKQLRQIEQAAQATLERNALMCAAGAAAAKFALTLLKGSKQTVLILVGPGNNGGDALETAVHLAKAEHLVSILYYPPKTSPSPETQQALKKAQDCSQLIWLTGETVLDDHFSLVIDGLFGIGLTQQKMAVGLQHHIEQVNSMTCAVLALDVPSGLDADTGNLITSVVIRASHTITFIGDKVGLHTGNGRDYAGQVCVADLSIAVDFFPNSEIQLTTTNLFPSIYQPRRYNSHKGSNGTVALIGGALGMQGALILASRAALYSGAGRVFAGFIDAPHNYDAHQPEIMCRHAQQLPIDEHTVIAIGPGMGNSVSSFELLSKHLLTSNPLIIDADALTLLAQQPALQALCYGRDHASTILTPHPLEAARLLGCSVEKIQGDRVAAAKNLARRYSSIVILKGSGSVLAHPNGGMAINPTGNAGLASGGTGDVLTGICAALVAQHKDLWQAALAAVFVHGAAADNLVAQGIGPVGLSASELFSEVRRSLNHP